MKSEISKHPLEYVTYIIPLSRLLHFQDPAKQVLDTAGTQQTLAE